MVSKHSKTMTPTEFVKAFHSHIKTAKPHSSEILDMNSMGGAAADLLPFVSRTFGGDRAGRAKAVADATGQEASFNVKHPMTTNILSGAAGGLLGAAAGADIGKQIGNGNVGIGAAVGGVGGVVLGPLLAAIARRREMSKIMQNYDAAETVNSDVPKFNSAATILAPFRGAHRLGQLDAHKLMAGKKPAERGLRNTLYAGQHGAELVTGPMSPIVSLVSGLTGNLHAAGEAKRLRKESV